MPRSAAAIIALVLSSAALYVLSFPRWSFAYLAWVALVPLLIALQGLSPGRGFLAGLLWGTAIIWGIGFWLPPALSTYWGQPPWFGLLCGLIGSVVFVGLYTAGFAACACQISRRFTGISRAAGIAMLWVAWEAARGRLLTGDPWLLIGYALTPHPRWIQIADLGGIYLVSLVVAFANATLAEISAATPARTVVRLLAALGLVLGATFVYGGIKLAAPLREPDLRIGVVQANNDLGSQWKAEFYGAGLEEYSALSRAAAPVDLLIWPESAVTFFLARETVYQRRIAELARETGSELIIGAPHIDDSDPALPRFFNSAFHVAADGRLGGRYDKTHLLPFGEYFPLRTIALLRRQFERVRTFTPGEELQLLQTDRGKVAVVICFEAIFPELVRERMAAGADFLVNLSNDAWLGAGAGPEQHLAMIPMRAVENRTWVARATTTGVSAIIDPNGRIVARSGIAEATVVTGRIAARTAGTVYQRWGDIAAYLSIGGSVLLLMLSVGYRRQRPL